MNWIKKIIAWYRGSEFRKFVHTEGFGDDTDYIEYFKGVTTCVSTTGKRTVTGQGLKLLERWVEEGVYKEIT